MLDWIFWATAWAAIAGLVLIVWTVGIWMLYQIIKFWVNVWRDWI